MLRSRYTSAAGTRMVWRRWGRERLRNAAVTPGRPPSLIPNFIISYPRGITWNSNTRNVKKERIKQALEKQEPKCYCCGSQQQRISQNALVIILVQRTPPSPPLCFISNDLSFVQHISGEKHQER